MNDDLQSLQGCWKIVSLEIDGQVLQANVLHEASITISGDTFVSTGMGVVYKGTVEIDFNAAPKTFDMKYTDGPEKGTTNLGIYELSGDRWRICLATRGTVRPREFKAVAGTGIAVEILEREVALPK